MARSLMVFLNGLAIPAPDRRGNVVRDDCFLVVFNAHDEAITFTLPEEEYGPEWYIEIDTSLSASAATHASALASDPVTAASSSAAASTVLEPETEFSVSARSIVVLRSPCGPEA
jgi:glycogen operon protein